MVTTTAEPAIDGTERRTDDLPSTGERFVPGLGGAIELEHVHRYVFARQVCTDRVVLDIACGEGYGSAMLAQVARRVIGVDIAAEAVEHATKRYASDDLSFARGSCAAIPVDDASIDVVVSFETIEHHDQHEEMMREIRRVLRPGGLLVLSSPERFEYSERPGTRNEFHVHELYRSEFVELVRRHFAHADFYDQKVLFGSAILAERVATHAASMHASQLEERARGLVRPLYLIAVASQAPVPALDTGIFEQALAETSEWKWWIDTVAQRDEQIRRMSTLLQELEGLRVREAENAGLASALAASREELIALQKHAIESSAASRADRAALQADFAARLAERDDAHAMRRELEAQQHTAALADAQRGARAAGETIEALRREVQRLVKRYDDTCATTQAALDGQRTELARLVERQRDLDAELGGRKAHVRQLESAVGAREDALRASAAELEATIQALTAERAVRQALLDSTSWRVTRPLRMLKDAFRSDESVTRRGGRLGLAALRQAYRRVPASENARRRAKDAFFRTFAFALRDTGSYRAWVSYNSTIDDAGRAPQLAEPKLDDSLPLDESSGRPIPQLAEQTTVMAEPVTLAPTYSATGTPLWVADGHAEWTDLPVLRDRIEQTAAAHLASIETAAFPTIEAPDDGLEAFADSIVFPATSDPTVTVLVPAYNRIAMTLECLASVARARTSVPYEVLVADDASIDATPSLLRRIGHVKVHRNTENLHFLRNCNAALPEAMGRYVVFLNNDVQVQDGWLDEMLAAFDRHDRVGAVGPKMIYPSGRLQEAGCVINIDMSVEMVGLHDDPTLPRYNYARRVDYCSGACLMVPTALVRALGGFDEAFAPAYCEDGDLCLRIRETGLFVYYVPSATVVHRLSATTAADSIEEKRRMVARNLATFASKWQTRIEERADVRTIAFYLPQFYPFPENDRWWGKGFTEWTNVTKAQPNFVGHYQPHLPADLGYYDLRVSETMDEQAALARRYGLGGFCYYYYWFAGKRLLDLPVERLLATDRPAFPFCLCWANENWTRRWDGQETNVLMAQSHSDADDEAVILDLIRYFRSPHYIRIDGRPLLVIYRVTLFPDFARTAAHWRDVCRKAGIGEIYIAMVESFELVSNTFHPSTYGCDASVEFPPQGLAESIPPSGPLINPDFVGNCVDYRTLALRYCNRTVPAYTRFRGAMPGWDNTPRRQNNSYCIEHASPGGFQAWLEHVIDDTRRQHFGDERIVFINAWNEWAEGAHLEPDRRFGHTYLEALANAKDRASLLRLHRYAFD